MGIYTKTWCLCVLVAQSCPTLCDPKHYSPPGSSVHGILQARTLEWVAISFSRGSSWTRDWTQASCIAGRRFTVWATFTFTVWAHQNLQDVAKTTLRKICDIKECYCQKGKGNYLAVTVVRTWCFTARVQVQTLVRELRSHKPQGSGG